MAKTELKVFISSRDSTCGECKEALGRNAWITLAGEKGALCLACADLDHLVFLPAGNAALTRRSKKHSTLSAVVLSWNRRRKRYERRGLLVEEEGLELAEQQCLADHDYRARRRERDAVRREELDKKYVETFAQQIRKQYPGCPKGREVKIAEHACLKYSGRVGRSAKAKQFSEKMIRLAVMAHIRHAETRYDELLMMGHDRHEARQQIEAELFDVLAKWEA
ncbi:DUF2293 domain-containing protein [Anaerolineales bacterium HSG24]|nr:DUF2293 domain-containing protein [Anaerolineales bacterium HSG24]